MSTLLTKASKLPRICLPFFGRICLLIEYVTYNYLSLVKLFTYPVVQMFYLAHYNNG